MKPFNTYESAIQGKSTWCFGTTKSMRGLLALVLLTPLSALAHHPLAGRSPETAIEGLLSGIGHPVIGIDHLALIVAVVLLAAATRRRLLMPVGFVVGSKVS